jgi:hypothetical protein
MSANISSFLFIVGEAFIAVIIIQFSEELYCYVYTVYLVSLFFLQWMKK